MAAIPLLKKLGFVGTDAVPTPLYIRFRNPVESKRAMAEAIKRGYKELFDRNEYAESLDRPKLIALITEITGLDHDSRAVTGIFNTIEALKAFAHFEEGASSQFEDEKEEKPPITLSGKKKIDDVENPDSGSPSASQGPGAPIGLGLSYTINLNLPETTNVEVFNAIFKSLKENLLQR